MQSAREASVHRRITMVLQTLLVIGLGFALWENQWLAAATTLAILFVTLPTLLGRRFSLYIPVDPMRIPEMPLESRSEETQICCEYGFRAKHESDDVLLKEE